MVSTILLTNRLILQTFFLEIFSRFNSLDGGNFAEKLDELRIRFRTGA